MLILDTMCKQGTYSDYQTVLMTYTDHIKMPRDIMCKGVPVPPPQAKRVITRKVSCTKRVSKLNQKFDTWYEEIGRWAKFYGDNYAKICYRYHNLEIAW